MSDAAVQLLYAACTADESIAVYERAEDGTLKLLSTALCAGKPMWLCVNNSSGDMLARLAPKPERR